MSQAFPFAAIVAQDEMKLALLVAAVDRSVGGVMVFGDRGTGKSTAVRALASLLPEMEVVAGCLFRCDPKSPAPGEQHTFGLSMLEEFFLHAGWETALDHQASVKTILATVAKQNLDVVGFSISCKEFLDPLSDLIKKTRAASRNKEIAVMVGGQLFRDDPGLAEKLGRATVLPDAVLAVQKADILVSERASRDRTAEIIEGMTCR